MNELCSIFKNSNIEWWLYVTHHQTLFRLAKVISTMAISLSIVIFFRFESYYFLNSINYSSNDKNYMKIKHPIQMYLSSDHVSRIESLINYTFLTLKFVIDPFWISHQKFTWNLFIRL